MVHVKDLVQIQPAVRELPECPRENFLLLKIVVPFLGKPSTSHTAFDIDAL